ncbi:phage tail protein [Paenibacillus ihumii]|nr:phage tail protein [Paenibacillus ihumii]
MAKTDWSLNDTVQPQDMNAIGEEINQLREDVDHIEIPPASVTEAGIVKLSSATNSTSETLAATPRAVKSAYDAATAAQTTANAANTAAAAAQARADSAFQLGNERKAEVVAALVAKGISASTSESWNSLIEKMAGIIKATGNATAADVLSGKTFSNASGNNLTGTMPNQGTGGIITPGTTNQTKAAGYYSSPITVQGDAKLLPANLPKDVTLFGVTGVLERMTTTEKTAIARAITNKGVLASISDTNTVLAGKIDQIVTGMKSASGSLEFSGKIDQRTISNLDFTPQLAVIRVQLYRDSREGGDTNGFQLYVYFVVSRTSSSYRFNGRVSSPIYGSHDVSASLGATFGVNNVIVRFDGENVYPYQTMTYTIYG